MKDDLVSKGDTGLAAAHLNLWQHLQTWLPDDSIAIIFEDDEHLFSNWKARVTDAIAAIDGPIDFINLNTKRPTGLSVVKNGFDCYELYHFKPAKEVEGAHYDPSMDYNAWLSAYGISKKGIHKLMKGMKRSPMSLFNIDHDSQIDHTVGWVLANVSSIDAYVVTENLLSFHNESLSLRQGYNSNGEAKVLSYNQKKQPTQVREKILNCRKYS
jgi:GR25 family glycosyltransferase involved in LPS biosynthesis